MLIRQRKPLTPNEIITRYKKIIKHELLNNGSSCSFKDSLLLKAFESLEDLNFIHIEEDEIKLCVDPSKGLTFIRNHPDVPQVIKRIYNE